MEQVKAIDEAVIEKIVRTFYNKIRKDSLLGPIFNELITDWEPHLQNMCRFWSAVMLRTGGYSGRPMPKHVVLPIDATHFDQWLNIFNETVDELCQPEDAALFYQKAKQIARSLEMGVAFHNGASIKNNERFIRPD